MITQAKFIPSAELVGDCEYSHGGVVYRVRDGVGERIAGITLEHDLVAGRPTGQYTTREVALVKSGEVVPDVERDGVWLVPAKHVKAFGAALTAEATRRNAAASAAQKGR